MPGEKDLNQLLQTLDPVLHPGDYVYCHLLTIADINLRELILFFMEDEGYTVILTRETADSHHWKYDFVAAWITLKVHSSLEAVGLTAAFSTALSAAHISCNVVAASLHDHIFVSKGDADKAMEILKGLAMQSKS